MVRLVAGLMQVSRKMIDETRALTNNYAEKNLSSSTFFVDVYFHLFRTLSSISIKSNTFSVRQNPCFVF